jgi:transketolase
MPFQKSELAQDSINTLRFLAVDAVQKANSGHPGMPMGAAPMAYVTWHRHMKQDPGTPSWPDRDRFVLSAGHGSMLIYGLLHLAGYPLSIDDLKNFRQWGSKTPGHPENFVTVGVETTTGPLGQGFANGVGMALAEAWMAARYNRPGHTIVDHHTYGIVSDGDLMEGISHEAASLAGHLGLGKLIYMYDDNQISIDGPTDLSYSDDVTGRFEAYGWQVLMVEDGNDLEAIHAALTAAREEKKRPSLIRVRTVIGYGSPAKAGTAASHGSPLGPDEVTATKKALDWPLEPAFHVPSEVREHMAEIGSRGAADRKAWEERYQAWASEWPELAAEWKRCQQGGLPDGFIGKLPVFEAGGGMATRAASGKVLEAIGSTLPELLGGSADLTGSNLTDIPGRDGFQADRKDGGYIYFGVREHAMASICNGMVLHGGIKPYNGTFLVFSDYMRPAIRLSALMGLPVTYVLTHDSVGLGEDGPTHQPIEHYMALRAIPNLQFVRPADANETAMAWRLALETTDRPTLLALTRQKLPTIDRSRHGSAEGTLKGAYILREAGSTLKVLLLATGSEVEVALKAADLLEKDGIGVRVVSMPCWEVFQRQEAAYRESVLPNAIRARVSVEAGITFGWERYVGDHGASVGIDRFGASAPAEVLFEKLGITPENVVRTAKDVLSRVGS